MKNWYWYIGGIIIIILLIKACEGNERTITKEVIKYVPVTETITKTKIDTVYKKVYVEKTKTIKGKDTIIYKDNPSQGAIEARKYNTTIQSNKASADIQITTTGELLDVQGVINYEQKQTTREVLKIRDASGLFIYGSTTLDFKQPEAGVLYQFKNKIFINAGVIYNDFNGSVNAKVGLGVKVF